MTNITELLTDKILSIGFKNLTNNDFKQFTFTYLSTLNQ